jgi:N-acetylmuramoyl-L-alanine amidase
MARVYKVYKTYQVFLITLENFINVGGKARTNAKSCIHRLPELNFLGIMLPVRVTLIFFTLLVFVGLGMAQLNGVGTPRIASHSESGFTRVVLDAPTKPRFSVAVSGKTLTMTISPAQAAQSTGSSTSEDVVTWQLENKKSSAVLTLKTSFNLSSSKGWKAFALDPSGDQPYRIVIDIGEKLGAVAAVPKPPSKPVAKPSSKTPIKPKLTVVLDAGHGGIDSGMVGFVVEKNVTLNVALKVRSILESNGVNVILTRTGDYAWQGNGGCDKRCDLEQRSNMGSADRNAFVSIHVNSTASGFAQGIETYLFGQSPDAQTLAKAERENGGGSTGKALTKAARSFAQDLLNDQLAQLNIKFSRKLAAAVQSNLIAQTGAVNLGVKRAEFWVIRKPRIPSILIETGFGNHPTEGKNLATEWYRQKLALGIAKGILAFF